MIPKAVPVPPVNSRELRFFFVSSFFCVSLLATLGVAAVFDGAYGPSVQLAALHTEHGEVDVHDTLECVDMVRKCFSWCTQGRLVWSVVTMVYFEGIRVWATGVCEGLLF